MKVTRRYKDEFKALGPAKGENGEISPSLMLRDLSKPIEGLDAGQDFEAHIKGHCRGHECRDDGKHHYDLDVHDFDHKGGGKGTKQKKSGHEEVAEAMDKYDKEDKEKKEKKEKEKEEPKKEKAEAKEK